MTLLELRLDTTLFQELTCIAQTDIVAVRPHILVVGLPAGSLQIEIQDVNGKVISVSDSVNISSITSLDNAHKLVTFNIDAPMIEGAVFRVSLKSSGYTPTDSSYIAWVLDFDLRKYTSTFTPNVGVNAPLDVEIWQLREIGMVRELDFADGFESSAAPTGDTESLIANNTGPADVSSMIFTGTANEAIRIGYSAYRTDGSVEKRESGMIVLQFKPVSATWELEWGTDFDTDVGLTFTVVPGTGQVQYTTDDFSGQTIGHIKWQVNERFTPGA